MRTWILLLGCVAAAQVRPLHTRDLTRLSQVQVGEQLKKSDVIFVPVGAVETNGILPSGRDYVYPLAYAMTMAEETGGLYAPGLTWSYPGTTRIASGTMYMPPSDGVAHLKGMARTLLKQGFKRQVYLSASHGPAALTVGAMAREFFEETGIPVLYIDMDSYVARRQIAASERTRAMWGAHWITGRIGDLPLKGDYGEVHSEKLPENEGLRKLGQLGLSGSMALGSWVAGEMAHGGETNLPATSAEREAWGREGEAQIRALVKKMRMGEAMDALAEHARYTREVLLPRYGERVRQ